MCASWLIYLAIDLSAQIRKKKKLIKSDLSYEYDYKNRLFTCREKIIREIIIFTFLCFELTYGLVLITVAIRLFNWRIILIPISSNCSLASTTFLGSMYDTRFNNVYIADTNNHRVQVFSCNGDYLFMFCKKMNEPIGICISQNTVFVTQYDSHCINMYELGGKLIKSVGSKGNGEVQFM